MFMPPSIFVLIAAALSMWSAAVIHDDPDRRDYLT
jgi:hypothetical protein